MYVKYMHHMYTVALCHSHTAVLHRTGCEIHQHITHSNIRCRLCFYNKIISMGVPNSEKCSVMVSQGF